MIDALDGLAEPGDLLRLHIFYYNEGKGAFAKILHQRILPDHGLHILGQVGQHIIIDSCICHSEYGRNEQQHREHQDRHSKLYDLFCETHG